MRLGFDNALRKARAWLASSKTVSSVDYWEERARKFGRRAVLNLAHHESEFDRVTAQQLQLLLPIFSAQLLGHERRVLDFGCGPGRFTAGLANSIAGQALGFDISRELVALAPQSANVSYLAGPVDLLQNAEKFDIIWICLVLGGIKDAALPAVAAILSGRLHQGGLLFLVENTTKKADTAHWYYRDETYYCGLFPEIALQFKSTYRDAGEDVSVWAGRKHT